MTTTHMVQDSTWRCRRWCKGFKVCRASFPGSTGTFAERERERGGGLPRGDPPKQGEEEEEKEEEEEEEEREREREKEGLASGFAATTSQLLPPECSTCRKEAAGGCLIFWGLRLWGSPDFGRWALMPTAPSNPESQ